MQRIFGFVCVTWILVLMCTWMPTPGNALKCYICNSLTEESCDQLTGDKYLKSCHEVDDDDARNHTICRKQVFSAYSKAFEMHTQRTIRSCGYEKHPRLDCFYASNIDLKGTTCECLEDGCNESNMLFSMVQHMILTMLGGFLLSFIFT